MSTLNDTSLGSDDTSGTDLSAADTLAVAAGDLVVAFFKWEGANGATVIVDTGASTPEFSSANAIFDHASGDLHGVTRYWVATSAGNVTVRARLSAARTWRGLRCYSFRPAAGTELLLDTTAAAEGNSNSPSSGSASASAAGASMVGFSLYSSRTLTLGSGWSEAAEFTGSASAKTEYRLQTGSGSFTGDATLVEGSTFWIALMAIFKEVSTIQPIVAWIKA